MSPRPGAAAREELLHRVPLFSGLGRVELARLAAHLDPRDLADGETVVRQGEAGDSLYVVAAGRLGVHAAPPGGGPEVRLATVGPGDVFGEMALLTDEPRSATVRAEGAGRVLELGRGRFLDVLRREPAMFLTLATTLSRRLHSANEARAEGAAFITARVEQALAALPAERRDRLLDAALLEAPSGPALEALFGPGAAAVAEDLAAVGVAGDGARGPLQALRASIGVERDPTAVRARAARLADRLVAARRFEDALGMLARHGEPDAFGAALAAALRGVPPLAREAAGRWLDRLGAGEATRDPELALAAAARLEERGDAAGALALLQRALGAALVAQDEAGGQRLSVEVARLAGAAGETGETATRLGLRALRWRARERAGESRGRSLVGVGASAGLFAAAAWPGTGVQPRFVLLLLAAIALIMSRRAPDFAAGLGLVAAWMLLGIATPAEALAGFASKEWLFVLAIYGVAAATARSGVLLRLGLLLVRHLPPSLGAQAATLMATGVALTPLLPSGTGRVSLLSPLAVAVAEALRLPERGGAAATLGLGTWLGAAPMMFLFLTGSSTCLLAWGLLPEASRVRFSWTRWIAATAPLGAFLCAGGLALLLVLFRPGRLASPSRERIGLQAAVLGRPSRREIGMAAILFLTVAGFIAAPWLHVELTLVALLGLLAAVALGAFDTRAFQALDWSFLIFFGVVLGIGRLAVTLGLDRTATAAITALVGDSAPGAGVFVVVIALLSVLVRLVMDQDLTVLLMSVTLIPVAARLGLEPWLVTIALLATSAAWILPAQTPAYLVAQSGSEGRLFSHAQAQRLALAYTLLTLVGLALAVPYWRALGLV